MKTPTSLAVLIAISTALFGCAAPSTTTVSGVGDPSTTPHTLSPKANGSQSGITLDLRDRTLFEFQCELDECAYEISVDGWREGDHSARLLLELGNLEETQIDYDTVETVREPHNTFELDSRVLGGRSPLGLLVPRGRHYGVLQVTGDSPSDPLQASVDLSFLSRSSARQPLPVHADGRFAVDRYNATDETFTETWVVRLKDELDLDLSPSIGFFHVASGGADVRATYHCDGSDTPVHTILEEALVYSPSCSGWNESGELRFTVVSPPNSSYIIGVVGEDYLSSE